MFTIDPVDLIAGVIPRRQQRLVEAWAELHTDELSESWSRLQSGQLPRTLNRFEPRSPMTHSIHRVTSFAVVGPHALRVGFDDGTEQTIDFWPVLSGEMYRPLRDVGLFNQVRIDPEVHTLVWPNGADFDPTTLHDWPACKDAWIERAKRWDLQLAR